MFVDFHTGDYEVDVVRSGGNPALASMSIGIDKLWNRMIFFLVLLGFTLGIGVFLVAKSMGANRAAGMMASPEKMDLREVVVTDVQTARRQDAITFQNPNGAKPKAKFNTAFGKASAPLIWSAEDGTIRAWAVQHRAAKMPVMLDAGLMRLDLTKAEREAALASLKPAQA